MVEAHKLEKRFGDFVAVDGVDFTIAKGESFGFLGPNGAGKTSTMRMISCISPISGGTLRVLGMDPATEGAQIRARMGLVPQEDSLDLDLTVLDNLMIYGRYFDMPKKVIRQRADQLLEFAQLTERANDRVDPLSGGMKRRLTIARALISDPDLLILDEPTTGLDPQARHLLWDRLYRLKQQGVTLVITTHYMDEAEQLCDRLVVMDKGRFAAEGSPRQLIEHHATKEVVELRSSRAQHEEIAPQVAGLAERHRGAARPHPPLHRRRGRRARRRRRHGVGPAEHAGAPVDPRGRVPPADRPHPGRLSPTSPKDPCRPPRPSFSSTVRPCATRRVATPMWLRAALYWGYQYKRTWRSSVVTSFLIPVLYLTSLGVALGSLVDKHSHGVAGVSYVSFLAPGPACGDLHADRHQRHDVAGHGGHQVDAHVPGHAGGSPRRLRRAARPPGLGGDADGHRRDHLPVRHGRLRHRPFALGHLRLPAGVLTGMAFAVPMAAFSATQDKDTAFITLYRFVVIPLFLFSGTFFPISQLPLAPVPGLRHAALPRRRPLP